MIQQFKYNALNSYTIIIGRFKAFKQRKKPHWQLYFFVLLMLSYEQWIIGASSKPIYSVLNIHKQKPYDYTVNNKVLSVLPIKSCAHYLYSNQSNWGRWHQRADIFTL